MINLESTVLNGAEEGALQVTAKVVEGLGG